MKHIVIFLAFTFTVTFGLEFGVIYPVVASADSGVDSSVLITALFAAAMFIPALGVLFTRIVTKEGFRGSLIKPIQFKKNFKYYLMGWFGPIVLSVIGAALYFLIFPADFDPAMSTMAASLGAQLQAQGGDSLPDSALQGLLFVQLGVAIFLAPLLNFIPCFGEEWGWRGYLLPKVNERLSFIPTMLVTGTIWGLWHAPLIALGHNYGLDYVGWPFLGIIAMCFFCIVVGTFLNYLTIKAKSCIPAILAHGAVNGFAGVTLFFSVSGGNPFVGPIPVGIIGGFAFIVVAVVISIHMRNQTGEWSSSNALPNVPASDVGLV